MMVTAYGDDERRR